MNVFVCRPLVLLVLPSMKGKTDSTGDLAVKHLHTIICHHFFLFCFCFHLFFQEQCFSVLPWLSCTRFIDKACLRFIEIHLPLPSRVVGRACTTVPSLYNLFFFNGIIYLGTLTFLISELSRALTDQHLRLFSVMVYQLIFSKAFSLLVYNLAHKHIGKHARPWHSIDILFSYHVFHSFLLLCNLIKCFLILRLFSNTSLFREDVKQGQASKYAFSSSFLYSYPRYSILKQKPSRCPPPISPLEFHSNLHLLDIC